MNTRTRFCSSLTLALLASAFASGCQDDDSTSPGETADGGRRDSGAAAVSESGATSESSEAPVSQTPSASSAASDSSGISYTSELGDTTSSPRELGGDAAVSEVPAPDAAVGSGDSTFDTTDSLPSTDAGVSEPDASSSSQPADSATAPVSTASSEAPQFSSAPEVETGETSVEITNDSTTSESLSGTSASSGGTTSEPAPLDWVGVQVGEAAVRSVSVEPDGNDGYFGVVFDAEGNFFAVGSATEVSGDSPDTYMAVTKFLPNGDIDTTFGQNGVARKNVSVGGNEGVRAIALQTTGEPATQYIVIAGTAQFDPELEGLAANEQDVAVVRFTASGVVDSTFGQGGVVRLDLNSGTEGVDRNNNPAWVGNDAVWSLSTTLGDRLVIHGEQRSDALITLEDGGTEQRSDADWALVRLLPDGSLDPSFDGDGKVTLDLAGAGASARSATVLQDGSIIGTGYLTSEVLGQSTQQPVLYKVTSDGEFDANFAKQDIWAADGVFHDMVVAPPLRAEAYGAALQGTKLVTMGYGPTIGTGTGSDFIALRFTADGTLDTSFGTNGVVYVDAQGQSDNGRSLVVLPDNSIVGIGGGRKLLEDNVTVVSDGMLVMLTPDGAPIEAFGVGGTRLYEFGGTNDFLWAGAVSPDQSSLVVVGVKGGAGTGTDADTDGAVMVLPLQLLPQ